MAAEAVLLIFLVCFWSVKGNPNQNWEKWLQGAGGGLMFASIMPLRGTPRLHWWPKVFAIGLLMLLSTFITWNPKPKQSDSDRSSHL